MTVNGVDLELIPVRCPGDNALVFECSPEDVVRGKCRKCHGFVVYYKGLIFIEKQ